MEDWGGEQGAFSDIGVPDPEFDDWIRHTHSSLAEKARVSALRVQQNRKAPKAAVFFHCQSDDQPVSALINSRIGPKIGLDFLEKQDASIKKAKRPMCVQQDERRFNGVKRFDINVAALFAPLDVAIPMRRH